MPDLPQESAILSICSLIDQWPLFKIELEMCKTGIEMTLKNNFIEINAKN